MTLTSLEQAALDEVQDSVEAALDEVRQRNRAPVVIVLGPAESMSLELLLVRSGLPRQTIGTYHGVPVVYAQTPGVTVR